MALLTRRRCDHLKGEVGFSLISRTSKRMEPTEEVGRFLHMAADIPGRYDNALMEYRALPEPPAARTRSTTRSHVGRHHAPGPSGSHVPGAAVSARPTRRRNPPLCIGS